MTLSLDLETELIDRAKAAPPPVCMSSYRDAPRLDKIDQARPLFEEALASDELILGYFVAFDMAVLGEYWPDLLPAIWAKYDRFQIRDVLLDQKQIDIATRGAADDMGLDEMCARYDLPVPDKEGPWRTEFAALKGVPLNYWPPPAIQYCLEDAQRPLQIHQEQEDYAARWQAKCGEPLLHLAGREARKQFALYLITCWGIRTNPARVEKLRARLVRYMRHAGHWLRREGLVRPDGSKDTKKAKARMLSKMGDRASKTKTKEISLDKEACQESGDGLLQLYSEYSQAGTLSSRVEDLAQGVTLPLQSRFNSLLETSRSSCSKPAPPLVGQQSQNMPRKVGARECLTPRDGCLFISADLPTAELRSLSQACTKLFGASVMADQLNAGRDLHLWFGAQILGKSYEEAWASAESEEMQAARQSAKPCNFGFPGGLGLDKFRDFAWYTYRQKFTEGKAKQLKDAWLAAFPEMREYFGWVNRVLNGRDRGLFKCVMTGRWVGRRTYCQACNLQFQELTATGASDGLAEAQRRAYTDPASALWNFRAVLYTHDEIVMEGPEERAHEAALELSAVMAERFSQWHPDVPALPCTGKTKDPRVVQPVVSKVYSKKMKTVWGIDGRLQAWHD